jgi:integrase/recombinase XerD
MDAPIRGANLPRHPPATDLLGRRASLREIADLPGYASPPATWIYAAVDVAVLREVALPWPEATS